MPKLNRMMGLEPKRYAKRLEVIAKRLGVIETDQQAGKNVIRHWTVPSALLEQWQASNAPLAPLGGWLSLVQSAIEVIARAYQLAGCVDYLGAERH